MVNIGHEELKELVKRILSSGVLGRSQAYAAILNYLVECSKEGVSPKEITIAIDVLGRGVDFDVAKDSIVRVHFYHLRNKLQNYFEKYGANEQYRINIPKGQYLLTVEDIVPEKEPLPLLPKIKNTNTRSYLIGALVVLVCLNIYQLVYKQDESVVSASDALIQANTPWAKMMDDLTPIIVVIGDYYIFGELDDRGDISRMVREFDINSQDDLEERSNRDGLNEDYFNLDLSYIPTSTAYALAQIMPVLASQADKVTVKMMSELSTSDLVANHIVYLGYLSGLGSLHDLMFAASDLAIGATYDELFNLETDEYFYSSSGLAIGENSFQDYGMVTSFPSPSGNQLVLIAGMRDEGLINVSQQITDLNELSQIHSSFPEGDDTQSFEALYEVLGFDGTNFDTSLVYSRPLDTDIIWEARLIGNQQR